MDMRLYELTGKWAELQALAEDGEDVSARLAEVDDELQVKAERVGALLRSWSADQEALAAEEKRLAARRRALENNEERLREYIRQCMLAAGITRVKAPGFTLTLSERDQLVVDDESAVPADYKTERVEVKTYLDRKRIMDAFKEHGECVAGTRVVRNAILIVR
jgi:hypothetical protein